MKDLVDGRHRPPTDDVSVAKGYNGAGSRQSIRRWPVVVRLCGLALLVAVTSGCPTTSSGLANASASTATPQGASLSGLTVDQATMFRDGGTIVIKGKAADGTEVRVRMDGAIGSETKGVFFITQGDAAERRLTRMEAEGVIAAVDIAAKAPRSPLDPKVVEPFQEKLRDFQAGKEPLVR
jgi:hypothetical protein